MNRLLALRKLKNKKLWRILRPAIRSTLTNISLIKDLNPSFVAQDRESNNYSTNHNILVAKITGLLTNKRFLPEPMTSCRIYWRLLIRQKRRCGSVHCWSSLPRASTMRRTTNSLWSTPRMNWRCTGTFSRPTTQP